MPDKGHCKGKAASQRNRLALDAFKLPVHSPVCYNEQQEPALRNAR